MRGACKSAASGDRCGSRPEPSAFWKKAIFFESASSAQQTRPPITSECPPKNLVAECTTMCAPSASGRCRIGDIIVESIESSTPRDDSSAASARMSVMRIIGLDGDSMCTILVAGESAAASARTSVVLTKRTVTPCSADVTRETSRCMPP